MSEQTMEQATEIPPGPDAEDPSANLAAADATSKLIPVGEAIKYRRRAQQAEQKLQQIEQQLNDVQTQFESRLEQLATAEAQRDELQHQLETTRSRGCAERMLYDAGVVDIEAAMALLERRTGLSEELDDEKLGHVVGQLLQDKPFLLAAQTAAPSNKTASPRLQRAGHNARLAQAASQAANSGKARDVAEYLRLRRQTQHC